MENLNFEQTYTSYDAYDELEEIRKTLHEAQRKIYRRKLEDSSLSCSISFSLTSVPLDQP